MPKRTDGVVMEALDRERHWLRRASFLDQRIYHVGLLSEDRAETIYTTAHTLADGTVEYLRETRPVEPFDSIAALYLGAEMNGIVRLYQRRIAPATYEYIAIRTHKEFDNG